MVHNTIVKSWKQKSGTLTQHPDYIKFWDISSTWEWPVKKAKRKKVRK